MTIRFEWDSGNAAVNARKHGVSFDEARTVFEDDESLIIRIIAARKADRGERADYASRRAE